MRALHFAQVLAAGLVCACGPSTSISMGTDTTDTETGEGSTSGDGDEGTATDDGTGTGEPACEPRGEAILDWQHRRGEDGLPSAGGEIAVAIDGAGRIVAATTDETEADADILVTQHDAGGALRWTVRYEGPAGLHDDVLGVAVDPDGLAYVAVLEQTRELVAEGFGTIAEYAIVILAIDAEGGKRWRFVREIPPGEYGNNARAAGIALTSSGHVIVVDADAAGASTPPSFLRIDRFGNELVRRDLGVDSTGVYDVAIAVTPTDWAWVGISSYGETRIMRIKPLGEIEWDLRDQDPEAFLTGVAAGFGEHGHVVRRIGDAEAGTAGFRLSRYGPDGALAWETDTAFDTGDGHPGGVVLDCDGAPIVAAEIADYPMRSAWLFGFTTSGAPTFTASLADGTDAAPRSIARAADGALAIGGLEGTNDSLGPWLARVR